MSCQFLETGWLVLDLFQNGQLKYSKVKITPGYILWLKVLFNKMSIVFVLLCVDLTFFLLHLWCCTINTIYMYVHCREIQKKIVLSLKQEKIARQRLDFLTFSQAQTNICYICSQCTYLDYIQIIKGTFPTGILRTWEKINLLYTDVANIWPYTVY